MKTLKIVTGLKLLERRMELNRLLGEIVTSAIQRNMTRGRDLEGGQMKPVAPWVRAASSTRGRGANFTNIRPLLNTGQLRASIAPRLITNDRVEIYAYGKQQNKLNRMARGEKGRMQVAAKGVRGLYSGIRTGESGRQYVRINTPAGWRTKRVNSGTIAIHPRKRNPMVVGRVANNLVRKTTDDYIKRNVV